MKNYCLKKNSDKGIDQVNMKVENGWSATLVNLLSDGKYTVKEVPVEGYDVF